MMATGVRSAKRELYLTPFEVSALIKKSVSWVQKRAADGTLPHRRFGRDLRFIRSEIDAWAAKQTP